MAKSERQSRIRISLGIESGYVPCACRDCMEQLVWSPESGEAPYCADCVEADCAYRDCGECLVDPDDQG